MCWDCIGESVTEFKVIKLDDFKGELDRQKKAKNGKKRQRRNFSIALI